VLQIVASLIDDARVIIYDPRKCNLKFYRVMATVITIINYDRTVITIVNYDPKTFIVQATDLNKKGCRLGDW
jgi:hypothetical protein